MYRKEGSERLMRGENYVTGDIDAVCKLLRYESSPELINVSGPGIILTLVASGCYDLCQF